MHVKVWLLESIFKYHLLERIHLDIASLHLLLLKMLTEKLCVFLNVSSKTVNSILRFNRVFNILCYIQMFVQMLRKSLEYVNVRFS